MFLKQFNYLLTFLIVFLIVDNVYSYNYIDPKNEEGITNKIREIYDLKQQYEDLAGEYEEKVVDEPEYHYATSSTSYWWPIGSVETTEQDGVLFATGNPETVKITDKFGYRNGPFTNKREYHSGLDISGGRGLGKVNIIASRDGIVIQVTKGCTSARSCSNCGGSYGNYITIQHSDGNLTRYAHLYENSITVTEGQSVKQGQVIAQMGSSGCSTGAHLHFEVRVGGKPTDPLGYISDDNPRITNIISEGGNNSQTTCLTLKSAGYDDSAVAAIMQSLSDESGINPINLQNTSERRLGLNDQQYTEAVDNGSYKNFSNDSAGYGLAQWTSSGRKNNLFNFAKTSNSSIGDINMQLKFFLNELQNNYPAVNNYLLNVSHSTYEKGYEFCYKFEAPAAKDTSCPIRGKKASYYYDYAKNGCKE